MAVYHRAELDRWEVKVRHPFTGKQVVRQVDPRTGEPIRGERHGRDVEAFLRVDLAAPATEAASTLTLREHAREWWKLHVEPNTRGQTPANFKLHLERRILPALGDYPLNAITVPVVEQWRSALAKVGDKPPTVRKAMTVLSSMLGVAVRWHRIPANPCSPVPAPKHAPKHRRYLTKAEVLAIADACPGLRDRTMVILQAFTGLRPSELLGVRWTDIDGARLDIRHQLDASTLRLVATKDYQQGHVDLPDFVVDALDEWRAAAPYSTRSGLVFRRRDGGPIRLSTWRRSSFDRACIAAGFTMEVERANGTTFERAAFTPNDLRHHFATFVRDADLGPEYLCQRMRHSSPEYTMKTYGHLWREERTPAALAALNAALA